MPNSSTAFCVMTDMELALQRGEFFFLYQPRVTGPLGKLSGFELLMRRRHPSGEIMEPSRFISVVNDSRLAASFTDLVLQEAADTLSTWNTAGHRSLSLVVNLSALELSRPELPGKLRTLFLAKSLAPDRLIIELTRLVEPAQLDDLEDAIRAVRAAGVRVALDDFGASIAPLTLLHQLPVDILALDQSLIESVPDNANARRTLEKLILLGQRLGKHIVLKGVEKKTQYDWARRQPGVECQGHYLSKPLPHNRADALISKPEMDRANGVPSR
jgi:EAL domain-containing protein (putative c-di-GMP-specific phosphodiesterase class I)